MTKPSMTTADVRGYPVGTVVTTKFYPGHQFKVTRVKVPKDGPRVYTLDDRIFVCADDIVPVDVG
jgi:hypothetical protein